MKKQPRLRACLINHLIFIRKSDKLPVLFRRFVVSLPGINRNEMQRVLSFITIALFVALLCGCPKSDGGNPAGGDANEWILSNMRNDYLWFDEIPASPSMKAEWDDFFVSLLSGKDGKNYSGGHYYYSYIERETATKSPVALLSGSDGFGFEFYGQQVNQNGSTYVYARVYYVAKDSPAYKAGIRRGDWIGKVNNEMLTLTTWEKGTKLLSGQNVKLTRYYFSRSVPGITITERDEVTLSSGPVVDNPVFFKTIFTAGAKRIGYLVYNGFIAGPTDTDHAYDDELKQAFKDFKAQNINDLVVDLRYNPGGRITSCALLSSMIVGSGVSAQPTVFARMKYNSKNSTLVMNYLKENEMSGLNYGSASGVQLGLTRVYVLASSGSASASELLINSLRGIDGFTVYHIGDVTEGKNVGSDVYRTTKGGYKYTMHPILFTIANAKDFSDYSAGFTPSSTIIEESSVEQWKELGEPSELLLAEAVRHITTGSFSAVSADAKTKSASLPKPGIVGSSLDRKRGGAVNRVIEN